MDNIVVCNIQSIMQYCNIILEFIVLRNRINIYYIQLCTCIPTNDNVYLLYNNNINT